MKNQVSRRRFLKTSARAAFFVLLNWCGAWAAGWEWEQSAHTLALRDGTNVLWQFNTTGAGKPYFHPLGFPDGTVATDHRPADHKWHLGVWFSFKKVNGVNFWTESVDGKINGGAQVEVAGFDRQTNADHSAQILLDLRYLSGKGEPLLAERRTVHVSPPGASGYAITSRHRFTALREAVIEQNNYGGFCFRGAPGLRTWRWLQAAPATNAPPFAPSGGQMRPARWVALVESKKSGPTRGIAILDHPGNPRHPPQWHGIVSMPFLSPTFFAEADYPLAASQTCELSYRLVVFDGQDPAPYLDAQFAAFAAEPNQPNQPK